MYNVEPYVERCIRSLEDQNIPKDDYEIICINDGSPDNGRDVVISLQREYKNIILIDQVNQGVSIARNNGIDKAKGKYLLMVDPDDFLQPEVLKKRLDIIENNDIDVGNSGYVILDENFKETYNYDPLYNPDNVLTGIEYYNWYRQNVTDRRDDHSSWSIFFKTSFLNNNNLRYLADVPYLEDGEFIARANCLSKRMIFINGPFYMRTTRPGSATQSDLYHSVKARNGFLKAAHNLKSFQTDNCGNEEQKTFMNRHILHFTLVSIISVRGSEYFRYYPDLYNALKRGPLKKLETEGCSKWQKKMGSYYNCSIHCFYLNWLLYKFFKSLKMRIKKVL
jgi:glycosyltransferase involved in cell wall biosynthesis